MTGRSRGNGARRGCGGSFGGVGCAAVSYDGGGSVGAGVYFVSAMFQYLPPYKISEFYTAQQQQTYAGK